MKRAVSILLSIPAAALFHADSRADTVCLRGKRPFRHVKLINFDHGRVVFRGISDEYLRKTVARIDWMTRDDTPDFSRAERAAHAGHWTQAVDAYQAALDAEPPPWLNLLIRTRLVRALDRAGRFDEAVRLFLRLLAESPEAARATPPHVPGPPGSPVNQRAIAALQDGPSGANPDATAAARALLFELEIYEELGAAATDEQTTRTPERDAPQDDEQAPPPLLFGADPQPAQRAPRAAVPSGREIALDGLLLTAAASALDHDRPDRALAILDRTEALWSADDWPACKLLHARALLAADRPDEAVAAAQLAAANATDAECAADACYHAGLGLERLGRDAEALDAYRQAAERAPVGSAPLREEAERALKRLGG